MRYLDAVIPVFAAVCAANLPAQTISITAPAAGATIAGYSYTLTCALSGITNLSSIEYLVDGERTGIVQAQEPSTCTSFPWDTYFVGNGSHQFSAVARDVKGHVLATSSANTVNVENCLPQQASACSSTPSAANFGDIGVVVGSAVRFQYTGSNPGANILATIGFTSAGATPTVGNHCKQVEHGGTSASCTLTVSSNANRALVAWTGDGGSGTAPSISGFTCDPQATMSGFQGVWCFKLNPAAGSTTVTSSNPGSTANSFLYVQEIDGVTAENAAESSQQNCNPCGNGMPYSPPLVFGTNDIVFGGAVSSGTLSTWLAPSAYTLIDSSTLGATAVAYAIAPAAGQWFGIMGETVTGTGPLASNALNDTNLGYYPFASIDGLSIATATPTNISLPSLSWVIDSTKYPNGSHAFVHLATSTAGTLCSVCSQQFWRTFGMFERQVSMVNPILQSELRMQYRDVTICATASTLCPSSQSNGGIAVNTDGSTAPATLSSCGTSSNAAAATVALVSNQCVWTAVGIGSAFSTVTDANGFNRVTWAYSVASNVAANLGDDGNTYNSYNASHSKLWKTIFFSAGQLNPTSMSYFDSTYSQTQAMNDMVNAGFHAIDISPPNPPAWTDSPSTFQTAADSYTSTWCAIALAFGLKLQLTSDNWLGSAPENWLTTTAPSVALTGSWSGATPAFQYMAQSFANHVGCALSNVIKDEIGSQYHFTPDIGLTAPGIVIGTSYPAQSVNFTGPVDCTSNPCIVAMAGWGGTDLTFGFVITGSGVSGLDFNSSTGAPGVLIPTSIDANDFSFPRPSGVTGKYSASTCSGCTVTPNLAIQQFANFIVDKNGTANGNAGSPYGYIPGDLFKKIRGWSQGRVPASAPPAAINSGSVPNWCDPAIVQYCEQYSDNTTYYIPTRSAAIAMTTPSTLTDYGVRYNLANVMGLPFSVKAEGVTGGFTYQGWPGLGLSSCVGNTVTFPAPHNTPNVVPGMTRMRITGSSGAATCNTNLFIESSPTANTLAVSLAAPTFSATDNINGTVTFDDARQFTVKLCLASATGCGVGANSLEDANCPGDNILNERGHTFTVSATGWTGITFIFAPETTNNCGNGQLWWRQLPNFNATGGTGYVIPNNLFTWGRNWGGFESGPIFPAISVLYPLILGATQTHQYRLSGPVQTWDITGAGGTGQAWGAYGVNNLEATFNGVCAIDCANATNGGLSPHYENGTGTIDAYDDTALANIFSNRLAPWVLQPRLPSPDYGPFVEATARQDASGNRILWLQSFAEGTRAITVTGLGNYFQSGVPFVKYVFNPWPDRGIAVSTIAANTVTDTTANCYDCSIAYVFDASGTSVLNQPTVSLRLADISGATGVGIQFGYTSYDLNPGQTSTLPQWVDCGSTFPCTIPADRNLGAIYWRPVYYNSAGQALTGGGSSVLH